MYSDRIIPSNKAEEALRKENEKMKSEIGNLREFVRLQGKLTGGKMFTRSSLGIVAKEITKFAFAKGDTTELVPLLNDIYGYIASGDEVSWEGIVERSQPVIEWLRKHEYTPRAKRTADAQQMLSELRDVSVRLSETQR